MPRYRIFYLKASQVSTYREATPKQDTYELKRRDYVAAGEIEAISPYAAWRELQGEEERGTRKFGVGDVLESESASPLICNFWGFDAAQWRRPDPAQRSEESSPSTAA